MLDLFTTLGAAVTVIDCIAPSETYFGLGVPVAPEYPCVAVAYACADKPSLVAVVFEFAEVCAEEVDPAVDPADVVLASVDVCAYEVTCKTVAEPAADAGLHCPVFPAAQVTESPCVDAYGHFSCPLWSDGGLDTDIDIQEGIVNEICLDGKVLCRDRTSRGHKKYDAKK